HITPFHSKRNSRRPICSADFPPTRSGQFREYPRLQGSKREGEIEKQQKTAQATEGPCQRLLLQSQRRWPGETGHDRIPTDTHWRKVRSSSLSCVNVNSISTAVGGAFLVRPSHSSAHTLARES